MKLYSPKLISAIFAFTTLALLILWMAGSFTPVVDSSLRAPQTFSIDQKYLHSIKPQLTTTSESIPGTTVARDETIVSSRLLARIKQIHVRAGDTVKRGETLIELEKEDLIARVNQAKDQVKSITALRDDAKLKLARTRELASRKLAASAEVDAATASFNSLSAQLDHASQTLQEASVIHSYAEIAAPINGRIVDRLAEPGDTISPAQPLLLLYDPVSIRVEASVRESLAVKLEPGQEISAIIDAIDLHVTGHIDEIVPAADSASRSFQIKTSLNYNPGLMPGMFARLQIPTTRRQEILVPGSFVTEVGELNLVYLYTDQQIERRYIKLGQTFGTSVVATAGLAAGDIVITPKEATAQLSSAASP
ncbi:MAG: efflux RND transporter periplasmic adaptor subunit [Gammaproteobacteria bacterium]|jgi:membrane fusion protein, multidrug efflux system|nr:efflux RND transporter periplasmic adaptor subunit [Gammaproteobacteria bacterium]MBT4492256.1 efflux RND transporter periplasmic adaptor subunit [Gammaproteobacteria bacterium]MBT7371907.1 efflux RND transporter periplasmic adaptor subunit [Gammaproteobacteria bacterium]